MKRIDDPVRCRELIDAYFDYYNAYTSRRWDVMTEYISGDMTMFGTGIDEVAFDGAATRSFLRREFQQAPLPITYKVHCSEVYEVSEDVVVLMLIMDMHLLSRDEPMVFSNNRTTAIMKREKNGWKLVHGHWSQPDKDIDVGESVPYRLLMERSRQLEEKVLERTRKIKEQHDELLKLNQTKDKLFSLIAHDLISPFHTIMGFSEILEERIGQENCSQRQMVGMIRRQAQSAYDLLENLLEWAKSQTDAIANRPEPLRLSDIIKEVVLQTSLLSHKKETVIEVAVEDTLMVLADKHMLQVVLRNLLSNAIKYTDKGGKVKFAASVANGKVRISVQDDGIGMDGNKLNLLAEGVPIESTLGTNSERGSGLGLLLCVEFIRKMGDDLTIVSKLGEGSCFNFAIPHHQEQA
ncbi:MAG: ATP-binding protein [Bacteroidales bacterium]|nr:ATP-binding protein [Bacteroidales bacterium]